MEIYFDLNYPKNLAQALTLLHDLNQAQDFRIIRTQNIENINKEHSVIFLFDNGKKGLDISTDKHFEDGYKVFAFKLTSAESINFFQLMLMTLKLWSTILNTIQKENQPFVYTFTYQGRSLTKVR
jgi:uncharacterized protein YbcI